MVNVVVLQLLVGGSVA